MSWNLTPAAWLSGIPRPERIQRLWRPAPASAEIPLKAVEACLRCQLARDWRALLRCASRRGSRPGVVTASQALRASFASIEIPRSANRWLERLLGERDPEPGEVRLAVGTLAALQGRSSAQAVSVLRELVNRPGLSNDQRIDPTSLSRRQ